MKTGRLCTEAEHRRPRGLRPFPHLILMTVFCWRFAGAEQAKILTVKDLLALTPTAADFTIPYGEDPCQFGQLRLPEKPGPHPVAVVIHGGCWLAAYDLNHISPLASAITGLGLATWSLEYRRVGNKGGGWPGTFLDVADGVDHLTELAAAHDLDLDRVLVIGHSAAGHLALWAAARSRLPDDTPLSRPDPLSIRGAVSLAGVGDLSRMDGQPGCGDAVLKLMGGTREEVPLRYALGSPWELLPLGVPLILLQGRQDPIITPQGARAFHTAAQKRGDRCRLVMLEDAGHFELVIPGSSAWPDVRDALLALLK